MQGNHHLLTNGIDDSVSNLEDKCLHELFAEQAARSPDRIAVVSGEGRLTYQELNERANQLAHHLIALGVGPETLVGVCLERSLELVVGILGVLKAGGAYLPVDPECPSERLAFMWQDASIQFVLAQGHLLRDLPQGGTSVCWMDAESTQLAKESIANPPRSANSRNLAYVIYTSGSTGVPKGVLVEHRSVVNLFRATEHLYQFDSSDVWTLFHSQAFDFSVWELWGALLHGARLIVVPLVLARSPEEFAELLHRERVTVLNQTPSAFYQLIRAEPAPGGDLPLALRYVILAGEAVNLGSLRPWFDRHGDQRSLLVNMYGITETTVHVTFRPLTRKDAECETRGLIGTPIPGLRVEILDDALDRTPLGDIGEICVGGAGVARGYLNRPGLSAERFIPDPFDNDEDARLYRSGDLGRVLPNGELEYLGRNDHQVKIRGFRIELGEIESVLSGHDGVAQCVVVAREDQPDDRRLVAYWVRRGAAPIPTPILRAYVAAKLPEFMIPATFHELVQLPLSTNGKVVRAALPAPITRPSARNKVRRPARLDGGTTGVVVV